MQFTDLKQFEGGEDDRLKSVKHSMKYVQYTYFEHLGMQGVDFRKATHNKDFQFFLNIKLTCLLTLKVTEGQIIDRKIDR